MKEIETLVELNEDINNVLEKFKIFNYTTKELVIDEYYYDPKRYNLKPNKDNQINECLRLRQKVNKNYITYEDDVFDNNIWLYSNEYETKIKDIEIKKQIQTFIDSLNLKVSKELNIGKPELMLNNKNIKIE